MSDRNCGGELICNEGRCAAGSCDERDDACETEGGQRCLPRDDAVEECRPGESGCLTWQELEACGARQACETTGGVPGCECRDECANERRYCAGKAIRECRRDAQG